MQGNAVSSGCVSAIDCADMASCSNLGFTKSRQPKSSPKRTLDAVEDLETSMFRLQKSNRYPIDIR